MPHPKTEESKLTVSPMSVDLLTASGWLFSLGDIATAKATTIALAERGVAVVPVDAPRPGRTTVIGGGHVLGHQPHLAQFILPGRHVLNAVGAHLSGDFGYLREYRYLSVRDQTSADIIGVPCEIVPCPAVLLEPSPIAARTVLARQGHVVAHRDPLVERSLSTRSVQLLVIDPQPDRNLPWRSGGEEMPLTHSPEKIVSALRGAHACVTRSLHLGVFALCAGVPFACIDTGDEPQSNKMRDYWKRAEIEEVMYNGDDPIRHAIGLSYDWTAVLKKERLRCEKHFDEMVRSLSDIR